MMNKCQIEVKVTHAERGRQQAINALMRCLEEERFWTILTADYQASFRRAVQELTGESLAYQITVEEHDLMRYLRQKAERYESFV